MKKYTLLSIFLGISFIALQVNLWLGAGGLLQFLQLKTELQQQMTENTQLEARNSVLYAEVLDLKEGYDAIEERARVDLGMIKSNETFYQIIGQPHDASQ